MDTEKFCKKLNILPEELEGADESVLEQFLCSVLTLKESAVVAKFYGINRVKMTLTPISVEFGVTEVTIQKIRDRAMRKLSYPSRLNKLISLAKE
jgi:DNA-directed RNA polymerase sigma subunit (sigma70/sigma32)